MQDNKIYITSQMRWAQMCSGVCNYVNMQVYVLSSLPEYMAQQIATAIKQAIKKP